MALSRLLRIGFWLALAVVTIVTLMPAQYEQKLEIDLWDKAEHFVAFGGLAGLAMLAWPRRPAWLFAALIAAYGGLIEILQGLTGRDCDWHDLLADSLGALAAFTIIALLRRRGVDSPAVSR